ncbi:MAG: ABC transporter ATP-binding protein [Catenulispora sp.]|nr:ABC transporter ATP-binding protein [Catenulispora sp.]
MSPALEISGLEVRYGRVHALRGLSITVDSGEIVAVLGNNGAGKSTTLCAVSGLLPTAAGTIHAFGDDVTGAPPWKIVGRGVVHVPEGRRIFSRMTVHENLQLGGHLVPDKTAVATRITEVYDLLPILASRRAQQGGTLSGGEQQMLAIGRALVAGPRLLMLDEPSLGLAPMMVTQVMRLIAAVNERGAAVLLVEQNARAALRVAHRAYVLTDGAVALEGPAEQLLADPKVVSAYLGG